MIVGRPINPPLEQHSGYEGTTARCKVEDEDAVDPAFGMGYQPCTKSLMVRILLIGG
jgi:hypothetical protein